MINKIDKISSAAGDHSMNTRRILMQVLIAAAVCMAGADVGAAAVITVDVSGGADFTSIQSAVDAAAARDTIEVRSGTYHENVDVDKQITLIGEGADVVTVTATSSWGDVFYVANNWVNISGLTVTNTSGSVGIHLSGANHCNISRNNISGNRQGIYLWDSSNNRISNNTCSNNDNGIDLYGSNNRIYNNIYSNNGDGIELDSSSNNSIIDNDDQAYDDDTNQWDSDYPFGGNYWSDYAEKYLDAREIDESGIWDTQYDISGGADAKDKYPLISWSESSDDDGMTEISYDDGEKDGAWSFGSDSGKGHGILFDVDTPTTVTKVKIYGRIYDANPSFVPPGFGETFDVEIRDSSLNKLDSATYNYDDYFTESYDGAVIDIPDVSVDDDFYIWINTKSFQSTDIGKGILIGEDSDSPTGNSFKIETATDSILETWDSNWMIRAVVSECEKPDLIVSSINFNPNPANKYDDVIVSITVNNQGNGDAGLHYEFLGYPDRYTILKEWYCSGLEAGASKTFTHTLENVQHSDTYSACADWGQAVQESDDADNWLTAHLEVKEIEEKPDLTITNLSWSPEFQTSLDVVTYTVEITNIGTATAENFILKVDIGGEPMPDEYSIDTLLPGATHTQNTKIRKNCGDYNIITVVDADGTIVESDETNNVTVKRISIDCGESIERALIIGISDYQYANDLGPQAINSAKGIYNLLRWGYGYDRENVILLLNNEATKENIKSEISDIGSIGRKTDKNDKFVFYYTGHGAHTLGKEEGIVPYDVLVNDGKLDSNGCIFDLDKHFDEDYLGQNVFDGDLIAIFDTCLSGGFCEETDIDDGVPSGIDGDRRVVLMSTKAGEELMPWETNYLKFTRYLLDAFASHSNEADLNADRQVSVEEAFEYAKDEGLVLGWLQHPQIMDHYPDKTNREAELHISDEIIVDKHIVGEGGSSVHIHAYDSEGRHVGTTDSGNIVSEIPGAWYSGPESHPEEIIIFGISEDITFTIEGQVDETFNFTIRQFTDAKEIIVNYDDVSIKEIGIATVDVSQKNPTYTMEIDDDGDGTVDNTTEPTHIWINQAPNISITTPAANQSGNITISYNLKDAESDNCTIIAHYSLDNNTWLDATIGEGGDGIVNVTSTPDGVDHTFVWASYTDMQNMNAIVYFRIWPFDGDLSGDYATTEAFFVGNYSLGSISIGSASAPTNSTVTIPVSVANVTNISGISFDMLYNSSVVTVRSVIANESFVGSSITPNIDNVNGTTSIVLNNSNLISASAETPLIDITFNITGGSGSSTSLDLQNVEFNDSEFNPYTPAFVVDGQITVGIKGDFNDNGRVDIGDVAKVAFMVAGKVPENLNADFNGNGRVDIGDAAKIALYLAGKVGEL